MHVGSKAPSPNMDTHLAAPLVPLAAELRPHDCEVGSPVVAQKVLRNRGASWALLNGSFNEAGPYNEIPVRVDDHAVPRPLVQLPEFASPHLHERSREDGHPR